MGSNGGISRAMKISISLPPELVAEADRLRGDVPRSTWIARAIEQRIQIAAAVEKLRLATHEQKATA